MAAGPVGMRRCAGAGVIGREEGVAGLRRRGWVVAGDKKTRSSPSLLFLTKDLPMVAS